VSVMRKSKRAAKDAVMKWLARARPLRKLEADLLRQRKNLSDSGSVYEERIGGRDVVIKLAPNQVAARKNSELISRLYSSAIKRGLVRPRRYRLGFSPYYYADNSVGVMKKVPGVGFGNLLSRIRGELHENAREFEYARELGQIDAFILSHPSITAQELIRMQSELVANLQTINEEQRRQGKPQFTTDFGIYFAGINNLRVTGYDNRRHVFRLRLIDQFRMQTANKWDW